MTNCNKLTQATLKGRQLCKAELPSSLEQATMLTYLLSQLGNLTAANQTIIELYFNVARIAILLARIDSY